MKEKDACSCSAMANTGATVYVTGASGFINSWLIRRLLNRGMLLTALISYSSGDPHSVLNRRKSTQHHHDEQSHRPGTSNVVVVDTATVHDTEGKREIKRGKFITIAGPISHEWSTHSFLVEIPCHQLMRRHPCRRRAAKSAAPLR